MAAKKSAANPAKPKRLEGKPEELKPHELMLMASAQNASAMDKFGLYGEMDLSGLVQKLQQKNVQIQDGDMKPVEAMLYSQAQTLQAIFANMARRSGMNAGEHLKATEIYMRMALKAQAQCRATLETLAIVKNPQPYIRQANIAQGHQQVNNTYASASVHSGIPASSPANLPRAEVLENSPSPALPTRTGAGDFQKEPIELLKGKP